MTALVLGTRGSALALAQAALAAGALGGAVDTRVVRTTGDASSRPLHELGDGIFVGALEDALRKGEIDVAVHSLKDVPTGERPGLVMGAISMRELPPCNCPLAVTVNITSPRFVVVAGMAASCGGANNSCSFGTDMAAAPSTTNRSSNSKNMNVTLVCKFRFTGVTCNAIARSPFLRHSSGAVLNPELSQAQQSRQPEAAHCGDQVAHPGLAHCHPFQ